MNQHRGGYAPPQSRDELNLQKAWARSAVKVVPNPADQAITLRFAIDTRWGSMKLDLFDQSISQNLDRQRAEVLAVADQLENAGLLRRLSNNSNNTRRVYAAQMPPRRTHGNTGQ